MQNEDNRCFEYSVLCGLHHKEIKKNLFRPSLYKSYLDKLKFDGIELPVKMDDVSKFETMNEFPINVFGLDDNENITVLHAHTFKSEKPIINLLLIEDDYNSHYVFVKNLNSLFTKNKVNNFVCPKCLQRFLTKNAI